MSTQLDAVLTSFFFSEKGIWKRQLGQTIWGSFGLSVVGWFLHNPSVLDRLPWDYTPSLPGNRELYAVVRFMF